MRNQLSILKSIYVCSAPGALRETDVGDTAEHIAIDGIQSVEHYENTVTTQQGNTIRVAEI